MKNKIMGWYKKGLWTKKMVYDAVLKNIISLDDYNEIVKD